MDVGQRAAVGGPAGARAAEALWMRPAQGSFTAAWCPGGGLAAARRSAPALAWLPGCHRAWCGRMLQAAEDFLRRAEAVRRLARRPRGTAAGEPLDALLDAWDDLVSAVVLVELLFGRDSEAAHWAREASNELKDVEEELRSALEAPSDLTAPISEQQIKDHMLAAGQAMDRFGAAAATQVRRHRTLAPARPPRRARITGPAHEVTARPPRPL